MNKLTKPQQQLLTRAQNMEPTVYSDGSIREPRIYVQGPTYRTAESLERKGLGTLHYQGPSRGWFTAAK